MAITVSCAVCGRQYRLADETAGKMVKCVCGQQFAAQIAEPPAGLFEEALSAPSTRLASGPGATSRRRAPMRLNVKRSGPNAVLILAATGGALALAILLAVGTWMFTRPNTRAADRVSSESSSNEASNQGLAAPAQAVADVEPPKSAATLPNVAQTTATQPTTTASPSEVAAAEPNLMNYTGFTSWALSADTTKLVTYTVERKRESPKVIGFIGAVAVWDTATGKQLHS